LSKGEDIEKTLKDYHLVARILERTELKNKFLKGEKEEKIKLRLIYFCALNLTYQFASKGDIVVNEGHIGDCFFIILSGKLRVLKAFERKVNVNGEEYLRILSKLYEDGIFSRVYKTVDANISSYTVDVKHLPILKYILLIIKLKLCIEKAFTKNMIKELFQDFQLNILDFFKDLSQIDNNNFNRIAYMRIALNKISTNFIQDTPVDYTIYSYVEYENDYKSVVIFDQKFKLSLDSGKVFGDASLDERKGLR
jgi:hypothetical protein